MSAKPSSTTRSRARPAVLISLLLCAVGSTPLSASADDAAAIAELQQAVADLRARVAKLEGEIEDGVAMNPAKVVEPKPGGWRNPENWELLVRGMDEPRVTEILGEPDNVRKVNKFEYWEYGDYLVRMYFRRLKSFEGP